MYIPLNYYKTRTKFYINSVYEGYYDYELSELGKLIDRKCFLDVKWAKILCFIDEKIVKFDPKSKEYISGEESTEKQRNTLHKIILPKHHSLKQYVDFFDKIGYSIIVNSDKSTIKFINYSFREVFVMLDDNTWIESTFKIKNMSDVGDIKLINRKLPDYDDDIKQDPHFINMFGD